MKKFLCLLLVCFMQINAQEEEWLTILVHGAVGFAANISLSTIIQAKKDCIVGTSYEKNVIQVREHPYLFTMQPMQKLGLQPVKENTNTLNASYAFATLYDEMQRLCDHRQKNYFYTFGWSGLISESRRYDDARTFYCEVKKLITEFNRKRKNKKKIKVRILGYSHGATLTLNFAGLRKTEFCEDTFVIDELYLIGIPVTTHPTKQLRSPIFKKVYNIYSKGDRVQRLDIFSPTNLLSHRVFKGRNLDKVKQIEFRYTAPLRKSPCNCLSSNMRGTINQSPGHIELWFFGWTPNNYRKNLDMYPLSGAVFIPYLVCAAEKINCPHVTVDIRPESEKSLVRAYWDDEYTEVPFFTREQYTALLNKAIQFHPSRPEYKDSYVELQTSVDSGAYR
jgi:hypothetical protein